MGFWGLCNKFTYGVGYKILRTSGVSTDHWRLASHAFNENQAKWLLERRKASKVCDSVHFSELILASCTDEECVLESKFLTETLQLVHLTVRTCARTEQRNIRVLLFDGLHGVKKRCLAFPLSCLSPC